MLTRPVHMGIITLPNASWREMTRQWQYLEALGVDTLWVADHFINPHRCEDDWFEAWTLLAALATQTTRVRLGTLVTAVPLRNPALLARQAVTLDHISGGRLEFGLGTGLSYDADRSYGMIGIDPSIPKERVDRFHEAVQIVDRLLRHEVTTVTGHHFEVRSAQINPKSIQVPRPPMTVAAIGPRMLQLAVTYADVWNTYTQGLPAKAALLAVRERNQCIDEFCARANREPQTLRRSLLVYGGTPDITPFASLDAFVTFVNEYRAVGIEEFIFYYPPGAFYPGASKRQERIFEQAVTEILPN